MIKNRFVIVATALAYLWAGAIIAEAADFRTLNGTWAGQVTVVPGPTVVPVTVTLTTRGEQHITGTLTFGGSLTGSTGSVDGFAIAPTVFFARSVIHPPSGFLCGGITPGADSVIQGIATIDNNTPNVQILIQSGTGFCSDGIFVTTNLTKQP